MEDVEKHVDVKLVTDPVTYMRLVAKPNFDRSVKFDEKLVAVHMKKTKVLYNKPIYLGMCILELSKTLMYEFHYDYIKPKYGDKARITCQRVSAWQCSMGGVAFLWERVNFGPRQNKNHPTDQDQIWQA
jgi:hypothetical protein